MRGLRQHPVSRDTVKAWSSDLDGAIAEGQNAFQMLGPPNRKPRVSERGERPGEMVLDAGAP